MPVIFDQVHPRVLQLTIIMPWTIDELMAIYPDEQKLFDAADPAKKIYSIVDITQMSAIPTGALRARFSPQVTHHNSAGVIIVGGSALAKSLTETVFRLSQYSKIHFASSHDEAWVYLNSLISVSTERNTKPEETH